MNKIANPQELQTELRRLLAYSKSPRPSRENIATSLQVLASRILTAGNNAPLSARLDKFYSQYPEARTISNNARTPLWMKLNKLYMDYLYDVWTAIHNLRRRANLTDRDAITIDWEHRFGGEEWVFKVGIHPFGGRDEMYFDVRARDPQQDAEQFIEWSTSHSLGM